MSEHLHIVEGDETTFDASNPRHVKKRRDESKRTDNKRDAFLSAMMEQPEGRSWMWWLMEQTNMYHASFSPNAMVMAHKEGARNVGLAVLAEVMRVAPAEYLLMMKERQDVGSS